MTKRKSVLKAKEFSIFVLNITNYSMSCKTIIFYLNKTNSASLKKT